MATPTEASPWCTSRRAPASWCRWPRAGAAPASDRGERPRSNANEGASQGTRARSRPKSPRITKAKRAAARSGGSAAARSNPRRPVPPTVLPLGHLQHRGPALHPPPAPASCRRKRRSRPRAGAARRSWGRSAPPDERGPDQPLAEPRVEAILAKDREIPIDALSGREAGAGVEMITPTFREDSMNWMSSAAAFCFAGSFAKLTQIQPPAPVDTTPASRWGMGAMSHLASSSGERLDSSSRNCQLPPRNMATSPATAAEESC